MEYTIQKLAKLAGITTRTLRYYDGIGLLHPAYVNESGYRIYGETEVDALQQILLFRDMGMELSKIKAITEDAAYNRVDIRIF
ncbi:MerR family transcriptional regulator [uncultured Robinsoniella sp.]|uniref:MerR family transcriptional regulator n=1 Tax=uncultured Robinsoniella sp. TaxID=904190 RepID=UPI00374F6D68